LKKILRKRNDFLKDYLVNMAQRKPPKWIKKKKIESDKWKIWKKKTKKTTFLKRTPIKQIWARKKRDLDNWLSEKALFLEIWAERDHQCQECWDPIEEPKAINFSHISSKWMNIKLKYEKTNILLVCAPCHLKHHWVNLKTDFIK